MDVCVSHAGGAGSFGSAGGEEEDISAPKEGESGQEQKDTGARKDTEAGRPALEGDNDEKAHVGDTLRKKLEAQGPTCAIIKVGQQVVGPIRVAAVLFHISPRILFVLRVHVRGPPFP